MSTFNPQFNRPPQKNNNNNHKNYFMPVFITLNGMSTGSLIRCTREMISNGYDSTLMLSALLYLLVCIRTGERIYQIHQSNKRDRNDNQR